MSANTWSRGKRRLGRVTVLLVIGGFVVVQVPRIASQVDQPPPDTGSPVAAPSEAAAATAPSPTPVVADGERVVLAGGETVWVDRACARRAQITVKRRALDQAAVGVAELRQVALTAKQRYERFLHLHPQSELPPALYRTFTRLQDELQAAVAVHNRQAASHNQAARAFNRVLIGCSTDR